MIKRILRSVILVAIVALSAITIAVPAMAASPCSSGSTSAMSFSAHVNPSTSKYSARESVPIAIPTSVDTASLSFLDDDKSIQGMFTGTVSIDPLGRRLPVPPSPTDVNFLHAPIRLPEGDSNISVDGRVISPIGVVDRVQVILCFTNS